ncbi:MAG: HAD-IIB family hydrolase [Firmicutes bacterium]|nr:HAD-IIB family hydrolase [Bacillota bacterium]
MLPTDTVILTDLDGTLLDARSYSWAEAAPALAEIARRRIPLIFCTSKTRAEVEYLRRKIGNSDPFITENGGGIFIPHGYFPQHIGGATRIGKYHCIALGRPYREIVSAFEEIAAVSGTQAVGFHQMSAREIAQNTNLPLRLAELARQRDFDEPFFLAGNDEAAATKFVALARARGLEVTRGGRFWHLHAGSDKGRAVRILLELFHSPSRLRRRGLHTIALGDAANDLPMLAAVTHPVLLPRPDGCYDPDVLRKLPHIEPAPAPGPRGWNAVVLRLLGVRDAGG